MPTVNTDFIVKRDDIATTEFLTTELPDLTPNQALLKIENFAFTANNLTYAVTGKSFGYWDFFPTKEDWGRIPVWGFANIMESKVDGLSAGERIYGYFPISQYLIVEPEKITEHTFVDMAEHRQKRSVIYNTYNRVVADPFYNRSDEALISLFRPLFTTSFLLDDYQAENNFFGAKSVILSSASSKTAIGTAFLLAQRNIRVIGLTSTKNVSFVDSLGIYDQVAAYDQLESLTHEAVSFIDMAGNLTVIERLHEHFGENLGDSALVGATHWESRGRSSQSLPGPKPQVFFAPTYAQERIKDWGFTSFQQQLGKQWTSFLPNAKQWILVTHDNGQKAVAETYQGFISNTNNPTNGYILSMWEQ